MKKISKIANRKNVFAYNDFPFEIVEDFNYLGVIFFHILILKLDIVGENSRLKLSENKDYLIRQMKTCTKKLIL